MELSEKKLYLTEEQVKGIIKTCVILLLNESMGMIDKKLETLANDIVIRVKNGENNFLIEPKTINQYQSYFVASKPIEVEVNSYKKGLASINRQGDKYVLYINPKTINMGDAAAVIIHEFTHMINFERYNVKDILVTDNVNINKLNYLFRDTERQARLSEFGYYLQYQLNNDIEIKRDIRTTEYESILLLDDMYELLECINNSKDLIINQELVMKLNDAGEMLPTKNIEASNYEAVKQSIYGWYLKNYNKFKRKAEKLLGYYYTLQHK